MGLREREEMLRKRADARARIRLSKGVQRLVAGNQMGQLFKVLACHPSRHAEAGTIQRGCTGRSEMIEASNTGKSLAASGTGSSPARAGFRPGFMHRSIPGLARMMTAIR
jgi:hypothetical protein